MGSDGRDDGHVVENELETAQAWSQSDPEHSHADRGVEAGLGTWSTADLALGRWMSAAACSSARSLRGKRSHTRARAAARLPVDVLDNVFVTRHEGCCRHREGLCAPKCVLDGVAPVRDCRY